MRYSDCTRKMPEFNQFLTEIENYNVNRNFSKSSGFSCFLTWFLKNLAFKKSLTQVARDIFWICYNVTKRGSVLHLSERQAAVLFVTSEFYHPGITSTYFLKRKDWNKRKKFEESLVRS